MNKLLVVALTVLSASLAMAQENIHAMGPTYTCTGIVEFAGHPTYMRILANGAMPQAGALFLNDSEQGMAAKITEENGVITYTGLEDEVVLKVDTNVRLPSSRVLTPRVFGAPTLVRGTFRMQVGTNLATSDELACALQYKNVRPE